MLSMVTIWWSWPIWSFVLVISMRVHAHDIFLLKEKID